jgi:hypothetical protein
MSKTKETAGNDDKQLDYINYGTDEQMVFYIQYLTCLFE